MKNPWKVGDLVRFAGEPEGTKRRVTAVNDHPIHPMISIEGMVGEFGFHIFVAWDYPADSIVPRPKR